MSYKFFKTQFPINCCFKFCYGIIFCLSEVDLFYQNQVLYYRDRLREQEENNEKLMDYISKNRGKKNNIKENETTPIEYK